jgi:hypothetical protein
METVEIGEATVNPPDTRVGPEDFQLLFTLINQIQNFA